MTDPPPPPARRPPPPPTSPTPTPDVSLDQPASAPPPGGNAFSAQQLQSGVRFAPRTAGGRVNGLVLRPGGNGEVFGGAGFREGDVLVAINGQPVTSAADAQRLAGQLTPGRNVSVQVERGADTVPIAISIAR